MSDTAPRTERLQRTDRTDYQATSDPALLSSADRGESQLLGYKQLYELWERQHWAHAGHRLHPGPDRLARAHRRRGALPAHVRAVVVLHRRAARGGRARPDDARRARRGHADLPLHADRRRGPPRRVLRPLLRRGRGARVRQPARTAWRRTRSTSTASSASSSTRCCTRAWTGWRASPRTRETLVEAVTIYHMVIEGMLALTGQHFIMDFNERQGTLPGFVEGFTNVARDEHRHVAFGARFLRDMVRRDQRHLRGDPAHARRGRPGRRRGPAPAVDGGRRRRADAVRRVGGRDARVRDEGAGAAHEGHRPRRRVSGPEIDFDQPRTSTCASAS